MEFIKDVKGQGAAEYILLFGGVIIIVIVSLSLYRIYFNTPSNLNVASDINEVRIRV